MLNIQVNFGTKLFQLLVSKNFLSGDALTRFYCIMIN